MTDGITDLGKLLASATPRLEPGRFVYVAVSDSRDVSALEPVCVFREAGAITIICTVERAENAGLTFDHVFRQITLQVHSSLAAVGFMAAISAALADAGIACNAVSAYYHDHIFVPEDKAAQAMELLSRLGKPV
jgi:hypothetical protein